MLVCAIFGAETLGKVTVGGIPFEATFPADSIRHKIGFVPEDRHRDGLMLSMTVEQNLVMPVLGTLVSRWVLDRRKMLERCQRANHRSEHSPFSERHRSQQAERRQPAKSFDRKMAATDSSILVLDEPTVGADVGAKAEIYSMLRKLKVAGKAILVVASDMEEVFTLADRIMVIREGRMQGMYDGDRVTQQQILAYIGREQ
jgi:ABC-type sugar transport system ATPase subunit